MFLNNATIVSHHNYVMLWVGNLTQDQLIEYVSEPGGMYDGPQSQFASDLGRFYNPDYYWAHASEPQTVRGLLAELQVDDELLVNEITSRVGEDLHFSTVLLLWNYLPLAPVQREFAKGKLQYVDAWPHKSPIRE